MTIELKIGNRVPTPINCYELAVSYMHGDADGDSEKEFSFVNSPEQIEKLKLHLAALEVIQDLDNCSDPLYELFIGRGFGEDEAASMTDQYRDNFYEGDMTSDGSVAAYIDDVTVYFYDAEGVKYEVKVKHEK